MALNNSAANNALSVRGLRKYFPVRRGFWQHTIGWIKAVDGIDLEVTTGHTLGLVGESGCGKSTAGRAILKLIEPDAGTVLFEGSDITGYSQKEMLPLRTRMQIIFQDPYGSLNPRMTIGQALEEGLRVKKIPRDAWPGRVRDLLDTVGIRQGATDRYPHEFSGGQRQRIGIARALSVEPSLIVCDEPVSALDVSVQAQVINLLQDLQERFGLSYLFIAHDLNVVGYMSDTVAVMYLGQIMEYGPATTIFDAPAHPYTRALFDAVPIPDPDRKKSATLLRGDVPSPFNPPPGCRFQGRCPLVEERCRLGDIVPAPKGPDHWIRCWK